MENVQDSKNQDVKDSETKNMESRGYMAKTGWEIFYDFLTEVFAILIPGAFFTSFFVFAVLICIGFGSGNASAGTPAVSGSVTSTIGLLIAALTYCFGALFHRREIKVVDEESARHIYKKGAHNSGHSFAFANAINENYVKRLVCILQYHLYLHKWNVTMPCNAEIKWAKEEELNPGEELVHKLNEEIEKVLEKEIKRVEMAKSEDFGIQTLVDWLMESDEKEIRRKKIVGFKDSLIDIVRRKLLAEKSEIRDIARSRSIENKQFLECLNDERHGTLKARLEDKVWATITEHVHKPVKPEQMAEKTDDTKADNTKKENSDNKKNNKKNNKKVSNAKKKKELELLQPVEILNRALEELNVEEPEQTWFSEIEDRIVELLWKDKEPRRKKKSFQQDKIKSFLVSVEIASKKFTKDFNENSVKGQESKHVYYQLEHAARRMWDLVKDDLKSPVEWPYTRMYQYCFDRGLSFANLVSWGDGATAEDDYVYVIDTIGLTTDATISDEYRRSKIRLNTDKVEISLKAPALGRVLEKNEAHIRFNNSMWYASKLLLKILIAVGLIILAAFCIGMRPGMLFLSKQVTRAIAENVHLWGYLLLLIILYLATCLYIRYSVREIMHYQRVREVTMYLEARQLIGKMEGNEEKRNEEKPNIWI